MNKTTWVVVADEAIARILEWPKKGKELQSVEELTDPTAHASGSDLRRDAEGRRAGSATHSASPHNAHRLRSSADVTSSAGEDAQHQEAERFARRVADHLAQALQQQRFDELRVVAAPRFLGLLRKAWSAQVQATIKDELNKDLIHAENRELTQRLFPDASAGA